jgi:hypothetical protein
VCLHNSKILQGQLKNVFGLAKPLLVITEILQGELKNALDFNKPFLVITKTPG